MVDEAAQVRPNQPQTLTGIETGLLLGLGQLLAGGPINLKPLQGLKHCQRHGLGGPGNAGRPNQPQTLTGIETFDGDRLKIRVGGPNQPQTLTGIETDRAEALPGNRHGPINLKPLQGLKRDEGLGSLGGEAAQSTSNPYRD